MKKNTFIAAALVATTFSGVSKAHAGSISIQSLRPSGNTTYTLIEDALMDTSSKALDSKKQLFFSAQLNVLNDPLVELDPNRNSKTAVLIDSVSTMDVTAGVFWEKNLGFNVNVPLNFVRSPGKTAEFGLGDIRLQGKYRLTDVNQPIAVAVIPQVFLPSGNQELLLSQGSLAAGVSISAERNFGRFRVAANLGYKYAPKALYRDIDYRQQLPIGIGGSVRIVRGLSVNAEASGALALPVSKFNNPGEVYAGAQYQITSEVTATAGMSLGNIGGNGSSDIRGIFGLKMVPMIQSSSIAKK